MFFVATGTAANALALAHVSRPGGVVFCHRTPISRSTRLARRNSCRAAAGCMRIDGVGGKLTPDALAAAIALYPPAGRLSRPAGRRFDQPTDRSGNGLSGGGNRGDRRRSRMRPGLPLHMDGARFANAVVGLGGTRQLSCIELIRILDR